MAKIPVGKTIAYAYSFTFGNFPTVLGLTWLPLVVIGAGAYLAMPPYFRAIQTTIADHDPSALPGALGLVFLFSIVAFICFLMIYIAVCRQALGLGTDRALVYFSFDRTLWVLTGAYLLMTAIYLGLVVVAGVVLGFLALVLTLSAGPIATAIAIGGIVVLLALAIVYAGLRAIFLLAPVAVAEGRHVLRRSWQLGRGNFWRILGILLAVIFPFFVAELVGFIIIGANLSLSPPPPDATPEQILVFFNQMGSQLYAFLPVLAPIALILYALVVGLMTSAEAFAYRALVPANESGGKPHT